MWKLIKAFFISIFLGGDTIKAYDGKYQEPVSISVKSKEQEQDELGKWLEEECILYDPNSPEAKAESSAIYEAFDNYFASEDFQIERGYIEDEDEERNLLSEEEADKLFNKHIYGSNEEEHLY